jgi:hypothetical protein
MNAPQPIEYTTPHKVVTLWQQEQLVVKNGYPCIDGGTVKHEGKYVPLMVRYDNKPELAAQVAKWQAEWQTYQDWKNALIASTKRTITTATKYNDSAENDTFSWSRWDGTNGNMLYHKPTGQHIYQMAFLDGPNGTMGTKITGEAKEQAMAFWAALAELQAEPAPLYTGAESARIEELAFEASEPKHGQNGYCRKCHSYCWGDCEANS